MKVKVFTSVLKLFILFSLLFSVSSPAQNSSGIQTPEKYFGFNPGTDRMLIDYEQLISYLQKVDKSSPRIKLVEIGKSPLGKKCIYVLFLQLKIFRIWID